MGVIDDQIAAFQALEPPVPASIQRLPSGAALVTIPNVVLPDGWSKPRTTVRFLAPVGYPHSKPDCFWADADLRLANGALPTAANTSNPIPEATNEPGLWFSWHVGQWNPSRDTLMTFYKVIQDRFRKLQ
jgi:hypothetical protein